MSTAGFAVVLKLAKDSLADTGLTTTDVGGVHKTYKITTSSKRVLDPTAAIVVKKNGTPISSGFVVDTLFGEVKFASALSGGDVVTVDASYLSPILPFAECHEVSFTDSLDVMDVTSFDTNGWKSKITGLADAMLEVSTFAPLLYDLDPGAATLTLFDLLTARRPFLVDIQFAPGDPLRFRGWFVATGVDEKIATGGPIDHPVKLAPVDVVVPGAGGSRTIFGWGTP